MITVVLAEDHPCTRAGIRLILGETPDIQIVGEAENGFEVKSLVEQLRPQVLLLDLIMPGPRPAEIEKWVRMHCPDTVTLILTSHDQDIYLAEMMDAGVSGYLIKSESIEKLIDAIRRAACGGKIFTEVQYARVQNWHVLAGSKWNVLTDRERAVLRLLLRGMDNATIAGELGVTTRTIAYHVTNLLGKLGVKSRQEVIAWVHEYMSDDLE